MTFSRIGAAFVVLTLLVGTPVQALKVQVDFDEGYAFGEATKVAWTAGTPSPNELNEKRIVSATEAQLREKGMTLVDRAEADLLVRTHVATEKEVSSSGRRLGVSVAKRTSWGSIGVGSSGGNRVKQVTVGTLIIELLDASTEALVWQAVASDTIDDSGKVAKKIEQAAEKAFRKYPPKTR